jgi:tetratricopeptide (TPR) repeat protein
MAVERLDRAHELILEGADRFPDNAALQAAAADSFVYVKGERAEALPRWRRAMQLDPKCFPALFNLAAEAASQGDPAEALDLLKRCVELDLEKTRRLWREDLESPLRRFGDVAKDREFRRLLGELEF